MAFRVSTKIKTSLPHQKIITLISLVPKGCVATYGQIAKLAGYPGYARQVVWTLHSSSKKYKLPWHRIINSQGKIGLPDEDSKQRQRALLQNEGVEFSDYGVVDLKSFGWKPKVNKAFRLAISIRRKGLAKLFNP